ncbi:hypothetical protein Tco_1291237, partial [Tanacetum coccineum]
MLFIIDNTSTCITDAGIQFWFVEFEVPEVVQKAIEVCCFMIMKPKHIFAAADKVTKFSRILDPELAIQHIAPCDKHKLSTCMFCWRGSSQKQEQEHHEKQPEVLKAAFGQLTGYNLQYCTYEWSGHVNYDDPARVVILTLFFQVLTSSRPWGYSYRNAKFCASYLSSLSL